MTLTSLKCEACALHTNIFDHAKYINEYLSKGIDVYASEGTFNARNIMKNHRVNIIKRQVQFKVGGFKILPFESKHDAIEPLNFLINHSETGNILSITDSWYSPFKFKGLNQAIIECNFSDDILQSNIESGLVHPSVGERSRTNHMSLDILKDLLRANDLTQVNNIVLIHLSSQNSDSKRFQKEIHELTHKTVTVAEKGIEIDFNIHPF